MYIPDVAIPDQLQCSTEMDRLHQNAETLPGHGSNCQLSQETCQWMPKSETQSTNVRCMGYTTEAKGKSPEVSDWEYGHRIDAQKNNRLTSVLVSVRKGKPSLGNYKKPHREILGRSLRFLVGTCPGSRSTDARCELQPIHHQKYSSLKIITLSTATRLASEYMTL